MWKSIIHRLVEHFGEKVQVDKLQEECQELALALHQAKCPTKDPIESENKIYDELADVTIMMKQALYLFDEDRINERVKVKLEKARAKYL